jgi:hypothetical protein
MKSFFDHLKLRFESKTGLTTGLVIWALIALIASVVTFGFILFAAFIWFAQHYGPLTAALVLCGVFLAIALAALGTSYFARKRNIEHAKVSLVARRATLWLDPGIASAGLRVGQAVGWRRAAPAIAAIALLAGAIWERSRRDHITE